MLRTRLKTAAILLPAVLAIILFAPPTAFTVFIIIVTAWGIYETVEMQQAGTAEWFGLVAVGAVGILQLLGIMIWGTARVPPFHLWFVLLSVGPSLWKLLIVGRNGPEAARIQRWSFSYPVCVSMLFPYFARLRNGQNGIAVLILMVLLVVASDSGAYFAGRSLGRIKLLPKVSPNKTVEGAIGGLVACVAVGLLLRKALIPDLAPPRMVALALIGGGLAQIGDLVNSAFKRIAGVKDSGWIFPGHGGLLDRSCSLVFPVTFAYYYLRQ